MAAINKLTDLAFRKVNASNSEQLLPDGGGLYVRIRSISDGGAISFRLTYRTQGKQKWLTLGSYPTMSLADAREARNKAKALLSEGKDPSVEKQLEKSRNKQLQREEKSNLEALEKRLTVNTLFNRWEKLDLSNHKDKGAAVRRLFEKDILPTIGNIAAEDVKKSDVISVVDALLERGVDRTAKIALALMRQMFRFAQNRDIVGADPTATIRKAKIGKPDTERDRVLSEEEIKSLCGKISSAHLSIPAEVAIWLALSTGCRIGEILKAKWAEINFEKKIWLIPSENSKNGIPLEIYLSDFAIKQFRNLRLVSNTTAWCYPNRDQDNHVCPKTITKQIIDRQIGEKRKPMQGRSKYTEGLILSGGKWTPHDLRRTAGTMMTALGVLPDIADKCLNHKEQNRIRRTYLRHNYENEKREAWRLLGERLELLTNTQAKNVAIIPNKAA